MKVLATLGWYDDSGEGLIVEADLATGRVTERLRWTPPPALRVPTKGFTGACWGRDPRGATRLYAAYHSCVARIDPSTWTVDGVLHQPCFNDLHDVATDGDLLHVVNTGAGSLDTFTREGTFLGSHTLVPTWVNARRIAGDFPGAWDPLLAPGWSGEPAAWAHGATEPYHTADAWHRAKVVDHLHPNHVSVGARLLVTCLYDGTVRDARTFEVVARVDGRPHDGIVDGERLWLTTIDGRLHGLPISGEKGERIMGRGGEPPRNAPPVVVRDLAAEGPYGWCRGLLLARDRVVVGFTEVRPERLPRHTWSDRPPAGSETSLCSYDRDTGALLGRVDLTHRRHAKVFAILPAGVS